MKVADVLQDEQLRLMPNPKPFDGYFEVLARLLITSEPRAVSLAERRGYWRAVVAIAAKNTRMCWPVLSKGDAFKLPAGI